jgi:hexosaminidase
VVEPRFAHENFHTDVWNNLGDNEDLAYRLANAGYKVVLTNVTNFYIDLAYNHSFYEIGQYWGGYVDLDKPFRFIPYNYYKNQTDYKTGKPVNIERYANRVRLNEDAKDNIVGIQAPLWAEIITSPERMEYLLLPKLFAVAERAWAKDPNWAIETDEAKAQQEYAHAWSVFVNEVGKRELPKMDYYGGGFNYRIPTVGVSEKEGNLYANIQLPGMTIRYTTDGSEPTATSPVYESPVPASGKVAFRAFNTEGRGGRTVNFTAR